MRFLFIVFVFSSTVCFAQKKDTVAVAKPDTAAFILNDFLIFLQDKITVKDYLPVQNMVNEYLRQREFTKPKKK